MPTPISRATGRIALLLGLAAALASLVVAAPATAGTTQVSGTQTLNDNGTPGAPGDDYYDVAGGLTGVWYTTGIDGLRFHDGGLTLQVTGTELFVGEVDGVAGWLAFEFNYTAKLDPASGQWVPGRCYHRIVDSGGGLAGATGSLTMKDRLAGGVPVTTYKGHVTLP